MQTYIPEIVENLNLPSPELVTYYTNLENRTIWLDTEVDELYLEYARLILNWNREDIGKDIKDRRPIKLMFMSPGGCLEINNAMIDVIKLSKTPIYGYNINSAASAACYIFMACHKRYALPHASFLLHRGSASNISGTYDQVASEMDEYERLIGELEVFILEHSSITHEVLDEYLSTEWHVTAKQAMDEYGFVDEIITDVDIML